MKRPDSWFQLIDLVNPKDLDEILTFCGRNSHSDSKHDNLREKYSKLVYNSISKGWRHPRNIEINDEFYETLIKCIQDFYHWSHQFHHIYANIYRRVVNTLDIEKELYEAEIK